jgi:hypothetical protein
MIITKNGQSNSLRTDKEELELLERDLKSLKPDERETLQILIDELKGEEQGLLAPDGGLFRQMSALEYKTTPVDMKTFIYDKYFLGNSSDTLYPQWSEALTELFEGGYQECIFGGGIGIGKTFAASVGIARVLYELSCMVNPHRSFGLGLDSNISIVAFSVTEMLATKVVFENVVTKIDSSPYFRENFPFEKTKKELRFPNRIWVAARATTDSSALGLNVISALLDEANFLPKPSASKANDPQFAGADRAETIYNAIKRRMKSRFEKFGKLPGILFIMSSKTTADDFVSRRINESKYDSSIFVREFSVWAAKKDKGYYESETFPVLAGNEQVPSRILEPGEAEKIRATLPEGCVITDVPIDFKPDFVTDLEKAIRDIAGIATLAISPFIQQREKILSAVDTTRKHPFSTLVYDATKGGMFRWDMMVEQKSVRQYGQRMEKVLPIINPLAPRHIHVDPSFRRDSLGFCMAHIGGWRDVIRRNPETQEKFKERAPIYMVDFLLRVVPPTGSEIILGDIRRLIYELTAHGYLITMVSMDTFQSVDSIQQLAQKGYNSRDISVDTTPEPYDSLKTALYEDRVNYYEYTPLLEELRSLEQRWDSRKKRKIDHPPRGAKDVADALSGCLWTLSQNAPSSQPLAPLRSESRVSSDDAWMEEQRQAELAGQRRASHTTPLLDDFGMLMPFLPPEKDPDPWGSGGGGGFGGGWP